MSRAHERQRGFTLIEVLVALVIVAFGIGALMATLTAAADSVVVMREKTFAQWIALNQVSELRTRGGPPVLGDSTGQVDFANQQWQWSAKVQETGLAELIRIDVDVGRVPQGTSGFVSIASATGFLSKSALARSNGEDPDWSGFAYGQSARQQPGGGTTPGTTPATTPGPGATTPSDTNPAPGTGGGLLNDAGARE